MENRLKMYREIRKLSSQALAKELGIFPSKLSKIEKGWTDPDKKIQAACAKILCVDMEILFPEPVYLKREKLLAEKIVADFDEDLHYRNGLFCGRLLTETERDRWVDRLERVLEDLIRERIPLDGLGELLVGKVRREMEAEEKVIMDKKKKMEKEMESERIRSLYQK